MTRKKEKREENSTTPDAAAERFFAFSTERANKSPSPLSARNTETTRKVRRIGDLSLIRLSNVYMRVNREFSSNTMRINSQWTNFLFNSLTWIFL